MSRFRLRIKILLKDRTACICYLISVIVMVCLLIGLKNSSEERSAVPIGLVINDESREAEFLRERIKQTPAVYVYEGELDELNEKLLEGNINSIFIIDEGYGERVRKGETDELVTIISGEDDRMSVIIGDILAGSMLYDICANKSYIAYSSLKDNKLTRDEYYSYIMGLKEDPRFAFTFEIETKSSGKETLKENQITNGMIYKQMIAGMLAMLICLVAFVSCNCFCLEYECGVAGRLKELPCNRISAEAMDFFGIFVYTLPLSIVAGILMSDFRSIVVSIIYLFIISILCMLISKTVKRTESYQLVGAVLVIGLGILGFVSVFAGLIGGPEFLKFTPNAIYIDQVTGF